MPLVEQTELFVRSIGEVTDIVEKEMYTFTDLNGESITLRPEGTASCVRAAIEHHLLYNGPQRLYYMGPMFRHEKPQKGRYRQFHQVGVEGLGFAGPGHGRRAHGDVRAAVEAARVCMACACRSTRLAAPRRVCVIASGWCNTWKRNLEQLDEDSRRRLHTNPLRVLDSKNPAMQPVIAAAPRLYDDLDEESLRAFRRVAAGFCAMLGLDYEINPRLVRGLDYYNYTVFEWVTDRLGAQAAVCAGGRYDGLFAQIGGKPTPACGFAMGVERLLALIAEDELPAARMPDAYLVHSGAEPRAWHGARRSSCAMPASMWCFIAAAAASSRR